MSALFSLAKYSDNDDEEEEEEEEEEEGGGGGGEGEREGEKQAQGQNRIKKFEKPGKKTSRDDDSLMAISNKNKINNKTTNNLNSKADFENEDAEEDEEQWPREEKLPDSEIERNSKKIRIDGGGAAQSVGALQREHQSSEENATESLREFIDQEEIPHRRQIRKKIRLAEPLDLPEFSEMSKSKEPNPELQARIVQYIQKKRAGANLNENLKKKKEFKNPEILSVIISQYKIDEFGSNYPTHVWSSAAVSKFNEEASKINKPGARTAITIFSSSPSSSSSSSSLFFLELTHTTHSFAIY